LRQEEIGMNAFTYLLFVLLFVPGAFFSFFLSFMFWRKKNEIPKRLAWSGVVSLCIYLILIVVPYHQGYRDLFRSVGYRVDALMPGEGFGLHHIVLFDSLVYLMTLGCSLCWLIAIVLQLAYGRICYRTKIDFVIRGILLILTGICLWYDRIITAVINAVLE